MSSRLSQEVSKLVTLARFEGIHDNDAIRELTMLVGYVYLVDSHPQCWDHIRKHLQAFMDLACTNGHRQLCARSAKITELCRNGGNEEENAA